MSEESTRNRIHAEELEKALARKDAQIAAQIKVLRDEKENLHKVAQSLREERRQTRGELLKHKSELDVFRSFSTAASDTVKEAAEDKVDIRGERRVLMLEKALEKSEVDRASLEKQLRELMAGGGGGAKTSINMQRDLPNTSARRPDVGSLPLFNTRTDDIASTAMAALSCLLTAGLVSYLQDTLGGGVKGGMSGAIIVMCGVMGFVFFVVCLFKFFLWAFGANSPDVLNQVSFTPPPADEGKHPPLKSLQT